MWPNIIVAVDRPPSSCQTRWTFSQSSVITLPRVIALRTRSTRISAPPPGRLPSPAALSRSSTVRSGSLATFVKWWISGGLNPWTLTCGKCALMSRSSSSYHSSFRCGMQPALHQDLVAAQRDGLADLLEQHVAVEDVGLGVVDLAIERAEVADRRADVGVVDVAVDVVGADTARDGAAGRRRRRPGPARAGRRAEQLDPFVERSGARRQRRAARSRRRWKTRFTPSGARPSARRHPGEPLEPGDLGLPEVVGQERGQVIVTRREVESQPRARASAASSSACASPSARLRSSASGRSPRSTPARTTQSANTNGKPVSACQASRQVDHRRETASLGHLHRPVADHQHGIGRALQRPGRPAATPRSAAAGPRAARRARPAPAPGWSATRHRAPAARSAPTAPG